MKNEDIVNGKYSEVVKWKPQPGEWCCFYDMPDDSFMVSKFNSKEDGLYYDIHYNKFQFCEPFIGTVPASLKGE